MIQVNGYDKDGICRVYGYGKDKSLAETEARWACKEYLTKPNARTDVGQIEQWSFRVAQRVA